MLQILLALSLFALSHASNGWKGKDRPRKARTRLYRNSWRGFHDYQHGGHPLHTQQYRTWNSQAQMVVNEERTWTPPWRQVCECERYRHRDTDYGDLDKRAEILARLNEMDEPEPLREGVATAHEVRLWLEHREFAEQIELAGWGRLGTWSATTKRPALSRQERERKRAARDAAKSAKAKSAKARFRTVIVPDPYVSPIALDERERFLARMGVSPVDAR